MQAIIQSQELASSIEIPKTGTTEQQNQSKVDEQQHGVRATESTRYRVFTDAAWKKNETTKLAKAGIGIAIHAGQQQKLTLHISATGKEVKSPLQAEALALQIAAQITTALTDREITFYVDNQVLAQAAACRNIHTSPGHWEIRHHLATFFQVTDNFQVQVYHINRSLNNEAHNCAATTDLALTSLHPDMTCSNSLHSQDQCPMLLKLGSLQMNDCKITHVHCSKC